MEGTGEYNVSESYIIVSSTLTTLGLQRSSAREEDKRMGGRGRVGHEERPKPLRQDIILSDHTYPLYHHSTP